MPSSTLTTASSNETMLTSETPGTLESADCTFATHPPQVTPVKFNLISWRADGAGACGLTVLPVTSGDNEDVSGSSTVVVVHAVTAKVKIVKIDSNFAIYI